MNGPTPTPASRACWRSTPPTSRPSSPWSASATRSVAVEDRSVLDRHIQLATGPGRPISLWEPASSPQPPPPDRQGGQRLPDGAGDLPRTRRGAARWGRSEESSGNSPWRCCIQEAQALGRHPQAVEVLHRMGKINEDMLGDVASASLLHRGAADHPDYSPPSGVARHPRERAELGGLRADPGGRGSGHRRGGGQGPGLAIGKYHSERREDAPGRHPLVRGGGAARPRLAEAALPLSDISSPGSGSRRSGCSTSSSADLARPGSAARRTRLLERGALAARCTGWATCRRKLGRRDRALASYE